MTDLIDTDGYRANVGIILTRADAQLFWAGRVGHPGWQFPQGGIRHDESLEDALYRELREEIGLSPADVELLGGTQGWLRYQLPKRYRRSGGTPPCIGQKQRWFMLRLASREDRVRLDRSARPEFDRWRWIDYWDPVREVIYFKRHVYARALAELAPLLFPERLPPRPEWWSEVLERRSRSR